MSVVGFARAPVRLLGARRPTLRSTAWTVASIGGFVVVWVIAALITNRSGTTLVPTPWHVFDKLAFLTHHRFAGKTLPMHALASAGRWGLGFAFAVGIGAPLGILFGSVPLVRAAVSPLFEFLRFIPPFAWIPLAILWLGATESSQALIVFIAAFPPVVINAQVAAAGVSPVLLRASRTLGAGRLRQLVNVIVPVAMPGVLVGMRTALSNGWMALIAAEMLAGNSGLGFLIIQSESNDDVALAMAGMIAIAITAVIIDLGLIVLGKRLIRWRVNASA